MAEGDVLKVREALTHLTTQYQSQQIDAGKFHEGIGALKSNYIPFSGAITGYAECYDYYEEQDPCLEAVQLGKAHVVPPQPLTDKEIFFRGMYPFIKAPEEKKALRELIQFSDEHGIPYSEYFTLLENALRKLTSEEVTSFEENVSRFNPHTFLLQCTLYAAMYALNKASSLTAEQIARMPEGLRLYYQGYEETVLGHIERWEIMPIRGNRDILVYSYPSNKLLIPKKIAFPSLYSPAELSPIFHELFHAYQDSRKIYQSSVYNELHAGLIGILSIIRIEKQRGSPLRRPFGTLKETALKSVEQKDADSKAQSVEFDSYSMSPEKLRTAFEYTWDWANAIMEGKKDEPNLSTKHEIIFDFAVEATGLGALFFGIKSSVEQQIFGNLSQISPFFYNDALKWLDESLETVNTGLNKAYASLGIDSSAEDKDIVVLQRMEELKGEFIKDDGHFYEMTKKYETQLRAFINDYYMNVTKKEVLLRAKIDLLNRQVSPEADPLKEEYVRYKNDVVEPLVRRYIAIFQRYNTDGIE